MYVNEELPSGGALIEQGLDSVAPYSAQEGVANDLLTNGHSITEMDGKIDLFIVITQEFLETAFT